LLQSKPGSEDAMNKQLEKMLKNYQSLVLERRSLIQQLAHFQGMTAEEVIESMYTPKMDGERVQTSNLSDKTAQIALTYKERMDQINREWYEHLEKRLLKVDEEIKFFESALDSISEHLRPIMKDMFLNGCTWDYLEGAYHICRMTIMRYKRKALAEMSEIYDNHDREMMAYILS